MGIVDLKQTKKKFGSYFIGKSSAMEDTSILPKVQRFRRQLGSTMRAFDKSGLLKKVPDSDYFVSRKVDGEYTVLVFQDDDAITINPGGTVRVGLPFMQEAAAILKETGVKKALIAGELYARVEGKSRTRIHDVIRLARGAKAQGDLDSLHFAVFDIYEIDDELVRGGFAEVHPKIVEWFGEGDKVHSIETKMAKTAKEVATIFDQWVEDEGEEGVVIRSDSSGMFKIKPRHTLDVVVVGFTEGTDDRVGWLHDMLLGIVRSSGNIQVLGKVGGGFSDDQRRDLLTNLKTLVCESDYAEVNSDRVAYQMVRPEWVIEISCLDLISRTTRGGTIDRMVLSWDEDKKKWEAVRRLPLVSVISPQFIRIREDKEPEEEDVRFSQLTDLVDIPEADRTAKELDLPKSTVMHRVVATKVLRGAEMIRKLVVWKTNKDEETTEYPAYVLHLTDFSPNRKSPLDHEIRVSNSEEQILEFFEEWKTKYFVGGWEVEDDSV